MDVDVKRFGVVVNVEDVVCRDVTGFVVKVGYTGHDEWRRSDAGDVGMGKWEFGKVFDRDWEFDVFLESVVKAIASGMYFRAELLTGSR